MTSTALRTWNRIATCWGIYGTAVPQVRSPVGQRSVLPKRTRPFSPWRASRAKPKRKKRCTRCTHRRWVDRSKLERVTHPCRSTTLYPCLFVFSPGVCRCCEAVLSRDEAKRSRALASLRTDPGLQQLLPHLCTFIQTNVRPDEDAWADVGSLKTVINSHSRTVRLADCMPPTCCTIEYPMRHSTRNETSRGTPDGIWDVSWDTPWSVPWGKGVR